MSESSAALDNVVPLSPALRREEARGAADDVRRQLRLLQGYADMMEGLSAEQSIRILKVVGEKIQELTVALRPFIQEASKTERPRVEDYRMARARHRELMTEYRLLIRRLHRSIRDTGSSLRASTPAG